MTRELTIRLHLAAFAVAITIVLGSQVPSLQRENCLAGLGNFAGLDLCFIYNFAGLDLCFIYYYY